MNIPQGRQMYVSERLMFAECSSTDEHIYFRANCAASMNKEDRFPCIAIKKDNGEIAFGECSCQAKADSRCAHIACLLYMIEDISLKQEPKILRPCTSQQQAWGRGSKRENAPAPVHEKRCGIHRYISCTFTWKHQFGMRARKITASVC